MIEGLKGDRQHITQIPTCCIRPHLSQPGKRHLPDLEPTILYLSLSFVFSCSNFEMKPAPAHLPEGEIHQYQCVSIGEMPVENALPITRGG